MKNPCNDCARYCLALVLTTRNAIHVPTGAVRTLTADRPDCVDEYHSVRTPWLQLH